MRSPFSTVSVCAKTLRRSVRTVCDPWSSASALKRRRLWLRSHSQPFSTLKAALSASHVLNCASAVRACATHSRSGGPAGPGRVAESTTFRIWLFCASPTLLPETHLLRQLRTRSGIIWCDHRIVGAQAPFFPILFRRHVVLRTQVTLERLEFLSVLQTDDVFGRDRFFHRNSRLKGFRRPFGRFA